ncbi:MAG TPA: hypothetical protein VMZ30_08720, partial [Pyrinomonadaceae bacterium]|nr:hypothetical protein [Pyrinomonadaceae bacterium]
MKDATSEAKRDTVSNVKLADSSLTGSAKPSTLTTSLGEYAAAVNKTLAEAERAKVIERIWSKDVSLWKQEESHQKIIANSLGWLTVPGEMSEVADELKTFAETVSASGFQHVMVCGMGGSSLCPEVLGQTFGRQKDFPELLVL